MLLGRGISDEEKGLVKRERDHATKANSQVTIVKPCILNYTMQNIFSMLFMFCIFLLTLVQCRIISIVMTRTGF